MFKKVLNRNKADVGRVTKECSGYSYGTQNPSGYCTGPIHRLVFVFHGVQDSDYNCLRLKTFFTY